MSLTKGELVKSISNDTGTSQEISLKILAVLLDIIGSTLAKGDDISIRGFGKFYAKPQKERKIRHPSTGQIIIIGPRRTAKFSCSKSLQEEINYYEDDIEPHNKLILQQLYDLIERSEDEEDQEDEEENY